MHVGEERKTVIIHVNATLTQREFKEIKSENINLSRKTKASGDIVDCVAVSESD